MAEISHTDVIPQKLRDSHPCFGGCVKGAGRIHLPVSPGCNIGCRFCERKFNDTELRPGVASRTVTPREASEYIDRALELCPAINVAGIAGPGDTLASENALETFRILKKKHPHLLRCMSTNGLLLPERAYEVAELVDTLTVTVNAVDPEIQKQINGFIIYHGRKYKGAEAARILIRNQLNGIRMVSEAGVFVKVNTVLIPDINGSHIAEIAETVRACGAILYNIIPLIPQGEMKDQRKPDFMEIVKARHDAEEFLPVFSHCRHCRADAVGVPGVSEYSREVYGGMMAVGDTFSHG